MKVNISGRGIVPIIGEIAPIYNRDVSENDINKLLNFQNFRVYASTTGELITNENIKKFFINNISKTADECTDEADEVSCENTLINEESTDELSSEVVDNDAVNGDAACDEEIINVADDNITENEDNTEMAETETSDASSNTDNSYKKYPNKKNKNWKR